MELVHALISPFCFTSCKQLTNHRSPFFMYLNTLPTTCTSVLLDFVLLSSVSLSYSYSCHLLGVCAHASLLKPLQRFSAHQVQLVFIYSLFIVLLYAALSLWRSTFLVFCLTHLSFVFCCLIIYQCVRFTT